MKESTTERKYTTTGPLTADHIPLTEDIEFRAYTAIVEFSRCLPQYFRDRTGMAGAPAEVRSSFAVVWACF